MAGRLTGKVALITGACSGIGLGTTELFLAEGAQVVAADLQDEKGAMLEKRFGDRLRYAHCNVMVETDIAAAVALAVSAFGGLDILFNNAGAGGMPGGVAGMTAQGWDDTFALLVRGPALGMHYALPTCKHVAVAQSSIPPRWRDCRRVMALWPIRQPSVPSFT